jgi:hypothetical protein
LCERANTGTVGVAPHGAHVRRRNRHHQEPGLIEADEMSAESTQFFFYRGPLHLDPLTHATVVTLFRARLGALRTEPAGAEQAPDVIRVVDDIEVVMDQIDDSSTGPQTRAVAGRFRPRDDQPRQSTALPRAELRRSPGGQPGAQASAALMSVRPLPAADGAPIDAQALGHDMNGDVTLEQLDRAKSSLLELSRAPLWAHAAPPTESIAN